MIPIKLSPEHFLGGCGRSEEEVMTVIDERPCRLETGGAVLQPQPGGLAKPSAERISLVSNGRSIQQRSRGQGSERRSSHGNLCNLWLGWLFIPSQKATISPLTAIANRAGPVAMGLRMVALAAAAAIVVIVGWQELPADWIPWIGWLFVP